MKLFFVVLIFIFVSCGNALETDNIQKFHEIYQKYLPICNSKTNYVKPRKDGWASEDPNRFFPWSLLSGNIHRFLDISYSPKEDIVYGINNENTPSKRFIHTHSYTTHNLPYCQTIDEILYVISQADWDTVPKCKLRWFSGSDICELTSQFSGLTFTGDSLLRHNMIAMFNLLSEDWIRGRYARNTNMNDCVCDGQYSEYTVCVRIMEDPQFINRIIESFQSFGFCQQKKDLPLTKFYFHTGAALNLNTNLDLTCEDIKKRPLFVGIQGGIHYGNDPNRMIKLFEEILNRIQRQYSSCMDSIYILIYGQQVCIPTFEKIFPHQNHNHTYDYNLKVMSWLANQGPNYNNHIYYLNPWNMTRLSLERTSDGVHFLTDHNLIISLALMNILHVISDRHGTKQIAHIKELINATNPFHYP